MKGLLDPSPNSSAKIVVLKVQENKTKQNKKNNSPNLRTHLRLNALGLALAFRSSSRVRRE